MKKILVLFMVLCGVVSGAWAGQQTDPKTKGTHDCVLIPGANDWDKLPYALYFNTAEHTVSDDCVADFKSVQSELAKLQEMDAVSYFVVVASADPQGEKTGYDNVALSKRRYDMVEKDILPIGATIGAPSGWVAGAATGTSFAPQYTDNWVYRSVYIYPVPKYAQTKCDQAFLDSLNTFEKGLNDIKAKYNASNANYENKSDVLSEIAKMEPKVAACKAKCPAPDQTVWNDTDLKYIQKNCVAFGAVFVDLVKRLPVEIQVEYSGTITRIDSSEIDRLYSNLKQTMAGFELSEWRDAEGRFNAARLASDVTAGVVLGTVGGIVTAKVVKKNQLKRGFEDINCSVGGQNVAKYGDQMRVGL